MLDWLKAILGEAHTDEIDKKVSDEIGKNFVARSDFNTVNLEKKSLTETVKERDKQLETLKASTGDVDALKSQIATLQADNATAAKTHAEELKKVKIDTAVELALTSAGAKNMKAAKALLDLAKAELAEDGSVKGLGEQIKALTKASDTSFMFVQADDGQSNYQGFKPGEKGDGAPDGTMTLDELRKMSATERYNFSVKNPETYNKLYGGHE